MNIKEKLSIKRMGTWLTTTSMALVTHSAFAEDFGNVASNITSTFSNVSKLVTGGAYVAGLGFAVGAIMKFKMHKDNPQSTPIGTPVALVFIAAALVFLPTALETTGATMFGASATTATPAGTDSIGA